jgi:hypothetical protein
MHARAARIVQAPRAIIWSLWEDVEGSPRWDDEVLCSRLDGPFRARTRGEFSLRSGLRVPFVLTDVGPDHYANRARFVPGLNVLFAHELIALGPRETMVIHEARFEGVLGRPLAPLLAAPLSRALKRALHAFGELAEVMH